MATVVGTASHAIVRAGAGIHAMALRELLMLRMVTVLLLCLAGTVVARADALDETLQPFCTQSAIAADACKCAGDVMRRAIPGSEMDMILRFARNQLSQDEVAKLPDGGAALRGKFADGWKQAQADCGVKK
jgi:hypothetical protein